MYKCVLEKIVHEKRKRKNKVMFEKENIPPNIPPIEVFNFSRFIQNKAKEVIRKWPGQKCLLQDLLTCLQNDPPAEEILRTNDEMLAFLLGSDKEIEISPDLKWVWIKEKYQNDKSMISIEKYLEYEKNLHELRKDPSPGNQQKEDDIMEQMDQIWYKLSPDDRKKLNGMSNENCDNNGN